MRQEIIVSTAVGEQLSRIFAQHGVRKPLLVLDAAFPFLATKEEYLSLPLPYVIFDTFTPNPLYEEVAAGVAVFRKHHCDAILAIGGGSAIDVAKCIKLYSGLDETRLYLEQEYRANDVLLLAIPTTAGTGSESTRYAVIYYQGEKQSVTHESIVPRYALLDWRNLVTLPLYQKKCTMLDAFCQSIESCWSVHRTAESQTHARAALDLILDNMDAYLDNRDDANRNVLIAANLAGRAINLAQTTAAHAMSYRITSLYAVPHGRAAFICLPFVWEYMWQVVDHEAGAGGEAGGGAGTGQLRALFSDLARHLRSSDVPQAIRFIHELDERLFATDRLRFDRNDIPQLVASVNPTRLRNNPIPLSEDVLTELYRAIVQKYS
ncbi:MAG: phosphonoacetaldehyde reductase [Bacillota bacterium]|nr:phosphonoacetaldehyde reductase [Bacillota bacterium]